MSRAQSICAVMCAGICASSFKKSSSCGTESYRDADNSLLMLSTLMPSQVEETGAEADADADVAGAVDADADADADVDVDAAADLSLIHI